MTMPATRAAATPRTGAVPVSGHHRSRRAQLVAAVAEGLGQEVRDCGEQAVADVRYDQADHVTRSAAHHAGRPVRGVAELCGGRGDPRLGLAADPGVVGQRPADCATRRSRAGQPRLSRSSCPGRAVARGGQRPHRHELTIALEPGGQLVRRPSSDLHRHAGAVRLVRLRRPVVNHRQSAGPCGRHPVDLACRCPTASSTSPSTYGSWRASRQLGTPASAKGLALPTTGLISAFPEGRSVTSGLRIKVTLIRACDQRHSPNPGITDPCDPQLLVTPVGLPGSGG